MIDPKTDLLHRAYLHLAAPITHAILGDSFVQCRFCGARCDVLFGTRHAESCPHGRLMIDIERELELPVRHREYANKKEMSDVH